jgi:hypothetical protein
MASTSSRGNYYKRKTRDWYEKQGYTVQLTEFMCATVIKGKCFYRKIDIFGSDGIAMNGKEIIFWNSKHMAQGQKINSDGQISKAKKEFQMYPFPPEVKLQVIMWEPRKQPLVINCEKLLTS